MATFRLTMALLVSMLSAPGALIAVAQSFPTKSIRMVASGVGGGGDFTARLIANEIAGPLGQPVVVDNRGGDIIPGEIVARAPADGHTVLVTGSSFWLVPYLYSNAPWDPIRDFAPITLAANSPNILSVHPSVPVGSVKELIAYAKARPGSVNYSAGGAVGATTLAAELFISMAGINVARINYKGGGPAVLALVAGEVQMTFATTGATTPFVKSGKLKALAITSAQPSPLAPNLPTVAASGLPGYESGASYAVFVPLRTPTAAADRLNQEMVRALNRADVKDKFFNTGVHAIGSSPQELAVTVKSEMIRLGKVIKDVGLRPE